MFKTNDGLTVNLHDNVYVIFNRYKENKLGRLYRSRDNTDVVIYKMEVLGIHAISGFDRESNSIDVCYAEGFAQDIDDLLPDGKPKANVHFYRDVRALPFNTFASQDAAETAFPEFRRRGLAGLNDEVFFADAP